MGRASCGHPRIEPDWRIARLIDGIAGGGRGALNLYLRWEAGEPVFHASATRQCIVALEDGRARADAAEARVLELEGLLRRRDPDNPDTGE